MENSDNRIDLIAIAYVIAHYDVKNMSVEEFFDTFKSVSNELHDTYSLG